MNTSLELSQDIYTSLKELGLTESEANLYITSLTLGPTTITSLAEHLHIPRPNVYKGIAGLERYGLAAFSERKRHARTFVVEPPTVLLEKLREKRNAMANLDQKLVSAMPNLLAHYHQGETPTKIKLFHGKREWLTLFFELLSEAKDQIHFFGSADAFIELITWEREKEWIAQRVEKGIHINVLLTPGKDALTLKESDPKEKRTTRLYKGELPFITWFMLYANKVAIWQPQAPLVLLIEDEYIVQMLRSIFDSLWKQAE